MSEAENVTESSPAPGASELSPDGMAQVLSRLTDIDGKLSCLSGISSRLEDGDRLFTGLQNNMAIVLRAVQVLLLKEATALDLVQSLSDVSGALERLQRERDERVAALPEDEKLPPTIRPPAP